MFVDEVAVFLNNLFYFFRLCSFSTPEDCGPESVEGSGACEVPFQPPEITQLYGVTARLEPLFQEAQKRLTSGKNFVLNFFFFMCVHGSAEVLSLFFVSERGCL